MMLRIEQNCYIKCYGFSDFAKECRRSVIDGLEQSRRIRPWNVVGSGGKMSKKSKFETIDIRVILLGIVKSPKISHTALSFFCLFEQTLIPFLNSHSFILLLRDSFNCIKCNKLLNYYTRYKASLLNEAKVSVSNKNLVFH